MNVREEFYKLGYQYRKRGDMIYYINEKENHAIIFDNKKWYHVNYLLWSSGKGGYMFSDLNAELRELVEIQLKEIGNE